MPDEAVRRIQRRLGRALSEWWLSDQVIHNGIDRERLGASLLPYLEAEGLQVVERPAPTPPAVAAEIDAINAIGVKRRAARQRSGSE